MRTRRIIDFTVTQVLYKWYNISSKKKSSMSFDTMQKSSTVQWLVFYTSTPFQNRWVSSVFLFLRHIAHKKTTEPCSSEVTRLASDWILPMNHLIFKFLLDIAYCADPHCKSDFFGINRCLLLKPQPFGTIVSFHFTSPKGVDHLHLRDHDRPHISVQLIRRGNAFQKLFSACTVKNLEGNRIFPSSQLATSLLET